MLPQATDPAAADLLLASVRQPGEAALLDIRVSGGVITHVGPAGQVPRDIPVVDLAGRFAIPGLWDEHVHMTQWSLAANRVDLSKAESAREAVEAVQTRLSGASPNRTLVGVGFRDAVWADVPSLEMLDAATHHLPTALLSHDLHCVWLNSAAASMYGVEVDASGLLREDAAFAVTRELGRLPDEVVDPWVRDAGRAAAARGVVGIVDFEMTWNRDVWLRRVAGGFGSLRVDAGVYPDDLQRAAAAGMHTGQELDGGAGPTGHSRCGRCWTPAQHWRSAPMPPSPRWIRGSRCQPRPPVPARTAAARGTRSRLSRAKRRWRPRHAGAAASRPVTRPTSRCSTATRWLFRMPSSPKCRWPRRWSRGGLRTGTREFRAT